MQINQDLLGTIPSDISDLKGTLLWTNPNLDKEFNPQTIKLDLREYDSVEIWFRQSGAGGSSIYRVQKNAGNSAVITFAWLGGTYNGDCLIMRNVGLSNESITFADCYGLGVGNNSASNKYNWGLVPIYIIGIKAEI